MSHKLRALSLVVLAVLGISAVAATAAQGATFTAASYPAFIHAEQTSEHVLTYAGRSFTCQKATFTGGELKEAGHTVSVTPEYSGCRSIILGNTLPATVTHNECKFDITIASTTPTAAEVHLLCPANKAIELHVYPDATHSTSVCTYRIPPQTVTGITYENMAGVPSDVTIETNSNVSTERTGGTLATCGAHLALPLT